METQITKPIKPAYKNKFYVIEKQHTVFDKNNIAVVYHHGCFDGQSALACVLAVYPDAIWIPGRYQTNIDISQFIDKEVIIVDFSYDVETTNRILAVAKSVSIFDHHIHAIRMLEEIKDKFKVCILDDTRCGAQIAYDYFINHSEIATGDYPIPIRLIADRDLWLHKESGTEAFNLSMKVNTYGPKSFVSKMQQLMFSDEGGFAMANLVGKGYNYEEYHRSIINGIVYKAYQTIIDDGTIVLMVNCPQMFASEVGAELAKNSPSGVSLTFEVGLDTTKYSMRVAETSDYDASVYCARYQGGGHKASAGYTVPNN